MARGTMSTIAMTQTRKFRIPWNIKLDASQNFQGVQAISNTT